MSNGSTREQLRMIHAFLVSGQTKIDDYLFVESKNPTNRVDFHEFLHSIILDDRRVFHEEDRGRFMNVFDSYSGAGASHFTTLRILSHLTALGQHGDLAPSDYVGQDVLFSVFEPLGIPQKSFRGHLARMIKHGLLMPESQNTEQISWEDPIALTKCGHFYNATLYYCFPYVAAMAPDTQISDQEIVSDIAAEVQQHAQMPKMPIAVRLRIAGRFISYLETEEQRELRGAVARHKDLGRVQFMPNVRAEFEHVRAAVSGKRSPY